MYDDIIKKFRKEYEKEIRSIFDPNSGEKKVTKRWLTSMIGGHARHYRRPKEILKVTKIDLRKKEFRNLEEKFKTNIPPIVEKYLNQVYERYETMHCPDSLLEILPELGCNDKREDFSKGLNKILDIIRLEHINIWGDTLRSRWYWFKRPPRLTAEYMSNSDNHLDTLLLATSNGYFNGKCGYFISSLCYNIYRHFEHGSRILEYSNACSYSWKSGVKYSSRHGCLSNMVVKPCKEFPFFDWVR